MSSAPGPVVLILTQPGARLAPAASGLGLEAVGGGLTEPLELACRLARQGVAVRVLGRAGDDTTGRRLREQLEAEGVDTRWLRLSAADGPTNLVIGGARPTRYRGAGASLSAADVGDEVLEGVGHLHLDAASLAEAALRTAALEARRRLEPHRASSSLNLDFAQVEGWPRYEAQAGLRALLGPGAVLLLSARQVTGLFPSFWDQEALLEGGRDLGAEAVAVLGEDGAVLISQQGRRRRLRPSPGQAAPTEVELHASLLAGHLEGRPLAQSLP